MKKFPEDLKIDFPNSEDAKAVSEMSNSALFNNTQILIQASKIVIDNEEETTELAQKIHAFYKLLHGKLYTRMADYPRGDDFEDYLASREERKRKARLLEETRITGSICPYCESTNVKKDGKRLSV